MPPRYPTVAVIGSGPAGISALKALHSEKAFDTVRVFERRDTPGGTWNYDETPQRFPGTHSNANYSSKPFVFPSMTPAHPEDKTILTAMYSWLDTNVPAELMTFTHTPLPEENSPISIERYGDGNATRPWHIVARYLLDIVKKYRDYISFNTTVVSVEKARTGKWTLTLRRPEIEEDKALYTSLRALIALSSMRFGACRTKRGQDHIRDRIPVSFPFLSPEPVLNADRVPEAFQHVFTIGDPSLAFLGLVRAPLLFRMIEYEAVATARHFAGRGGEFPSLEEQKRWEVEQVQLKGDTYKFHDVTKEIKDHMEFLRALAGPPAADTEGYELTPVANEWLEKCFSVFLLKDEYWGRVRREAEAQA